MSLKAGIVGLPNVGKSTLFNAITKSNVEAANYPFATISPNVGVVEVPDHRVDRLAELFHPKKKIYTTFEFTDIAGLVKGASKGEGLGNQFLSHIRQTDAICHVVRCFEDANITHVESRINPIEDLEIVELELILADLQTVENRIAKIQRKASSGGDKKAQEELNFLKGLQSHLQSSLPSREYERSEDQEEFLQNLQLITEKPVIYVANVDETGLIEENEHLKALKEYAEQHKTPVVVLSARLEEDLAQMEPEEKTAFLEELGLPQSGLDHLILSAYDLLGLQTFLTAGSDECRAWTFTRGTRAPQGAGIIHSDIERGFIKAEVYSFEDMDELESEAALKEKGKLRIEGKDYILQDGDVVHFRFNV